MKIFKDFFNSNDRNEIPKFNKSEIKRYHLIFFGRVQSVGFRYNTYDIANKLGLVGWVRNLSDGSVEAEIEGEKDKIDYLIKYMKSLPIPDIERIEKDEIDIKNEEEFNIR